ncbi:MAG: DNA-binding protein [Candidatus Riflebacteria bacterium]|nr:DNA-binding protein [Candidatus Riflebacteria bacterium]
MDYRKSGNRIVLRLNRGEEIISSITDLCKKENIKAASVNGIGATQSVEAGFYSFKKKKYCGYCFNQNMEILSLLGNISTKDDEPYLHLHIVVSNDEGEALGGHLTKAVISVTAEIFIDIIETQIGREADSLTGINLIKF